MSVHIYKKNGKEVGYRAMVSKGGKIGPGDSKVFRFSKHGPRPVTKAKAESWERTKRGGDDRKDIVFGDLLDLYKSEIWPTLKTSTVQGNMSKWHYLADSPLFSMRVSDIDMDSVVEWIDWLKSLPTASSERRKTFREELKLLSTVFKYYHHYRNNKWIIPITDMHRKMVKYKPITKTRPKRYYIEPRDVRNWLQWLAENRENKSLHRLALFMVHTGVRVGEACGMKWDAIDWEQGSCSIVRQVQWHYRSKQPYMDDGVKTANSEREIALPDIVLDMLNEVRSESKGDLIFTSDRGQMLKYNTIQGAFNAGFKALGLPWRSTHILRHTAASLALKATGGDLGAVQVMAGHSNRKTTEGYAKSQALYTRNTTQQLATLIDFKTGKLHESYTQDCNTKNNEAISEGYSEIEGKIVGPAGNKTGQG